MVKALTTRRTRHTQTLPSCDEPLAEGGGGGGDSSFSDHTSPASVALISSEFTPLNDVRPLFKTSSAANQKVHYPAVKLVSSSLQGEEAGGGRGKGEVQPIGFERFPEAPIDWVVSNGFFSLPRPLSSSSFSKSTSNRSRLPVAYQPALAAMFPSTERVFQLSTQVGSRFCWLVYQRHQNW
ncbi:hypothetical protein Ancab_008280 [Ancistrocladus abbreviatus]